MATRANLLPATTITMTATIVVLSRVLPVALVYTTKLLEGLPSENATETERRVNVSFSYMLVTLQCALSEPGAVHFFLLSLASTTYLPLSAYFRPWAPLSSVKLQGSWCARIFRFELGGRD